MAGAIQSPDRDAILLLLRDPEITDDADGSVLALAMDDDANLAGTLLLRRQKALKWHSHALRHQGSTDPS